LVGKSPGTDDGKGDGRAAIGVTAGPGWDIGREAGLARGGSFVFATRRLGFADLAFALRDGFRATAFFRRAGAARFFGFATFLALRFFAMIALRWFTR
jgi:hypothetical protein